MKLKTKLLTAAAGITLCAALTVSVSAYHDMGDKITYFVNSSQKNWDNRSEKNAWILHRDSDTKFEFSAGSGGKVNIQLRKWEFWSDPIMREWKDCIQGNHTYYLYGLTADDYYAKVELASGDSVSGEVTFSKFVRNN